MTWTVDRETATETFRLRVLAALDEAAQEVFADRLSAYNTAAGPRRFGMPAARPTRSCRFFSRPSTLNWSGLRNAMTLFWWAANSSQCRGTGAENDDEGEVR
jgi:hypothetical protein